MYYKTLFSHEVIKKYNKEIESCFLRVRYNYTGPIGLMALCYYLTTTTIGITLCVVLVETIRPGELMRDEGVSTPTTTKTFMTVDTILDLFR